MTNNKMPKVGDKFRTKPEYLPCSIIIDEVSENYVVYNSNGNINKKYIEDFLRVYDPIPQDPISQPSIWKDVSELPEYFEETAFLWRDTDGNIAIGGYYRHDNCVGGLTSGNVEKKYFCKLTDFINHIDSLEQRVKKLEEK